MKPVLLSITRLIKDLPLPKAATTGSAGIDLYSAHLRIKLEPGERFGFGTGIAVAIPEGYEGQVRARSGLAIRDGIGLVNGIGTIDSDYRGQIIVLLINHGEERVVLNYGDRIAQLVIAPVARVVVEELVSLPATERAEGGLGSTGT